MVCSYKTLRSVLLPVACAYCLSYVIQPRRVVAHEFLQLTCAQILALGNRFHRYGKLAVAVIVIRREYADGLRRRNP